MRWRRYPYTLFQTRSIREVSPHPSAIIGMGEDVRIQASPGPQQAWSMHQKYEEQRRQGSQSEPVSGPCDVFRI